MDERLSKRRSRGVAEHDSWNLKFEYRIAWLKYTWPEVKQERRLT